jgi:anti-sigma regulatory factor (Ser/Thr protein kinase)
MEEEQIVLAVPARERYLKHVRALVRSILAESGLDGDAADRFLRAVDEAVANRIRHCRPASDKPVRFTITPPPPEIRVRIAPFCTPDDTTRIRARDLSELKPGGLGTHLISLGADHVEYVESDDAGFYDLILTRRGSAG